VRIGALLDKALSGRIYDALVRLSVGGRSGDALQPSRDLDQVRSFLSSGGPLALFDFPWMPLYLFICFMFHPWIGWAAVAGALVLVTLTYLTELWTRDPAKAAVLHGARRASLAEASRRNAEVLQSMGMARPMAERWRLVNDEFLADNNRAADVSGGLGSTSKILRMALQSFVLGLGAYLVTQQQATGGIMIASAILVSRALAPVELTIAHWKSFVSARQSWKRLGDLLSAREQGERMALPAPTSSLSVENVSLIPPGDQRLVVRDATLSLRPGNALGIIGPSASGKSSLARAIVGIWPPARGKVRLDGAGLEQWEPDALGRHLGYLPQGVELFAGTVAENISRFQPGADPSAIIAAAKAAGVHDLIVRLPNGYDTAIGEQGGALSAGQRQRIALARALYGDPFLVVLDEPNSNLDTEGEAALTRAILGVRARGGIAIVIAHRPSALAGVDLVLVMNDGQVQAFGPKDEILKSVLRRPVQPGAPLKVVADAQGGA
jgi:ATP-binding cassette subfamily C protein